MKALYRYALTATGLAVTLTASAGVAEAQRVIEPDARILVATFRSAERGLGAQGADAVRSRVQGEIPIRQLLVLKKEDIDNTLTASGYRPDSALSDNDTRELAKLMRADEILTGVVRKTDTGVRVEARLSLARDVSLAQPLPPAEAKNVGDAAKQIARDLKEARKQLEDNQKCESALRESKFDEAIKHANDGIAKYPNATLARLCLASALQEKKAAPDEILAVTNKVIELDPKSKFAIGIAYQAYKNKGDNDRATDMLVQLFQADPTNVALLTEQIIPALVQAGNPQRAVSIVDTLVAQNPGDAQLVRTQWLVLLNAGNYKRAVEVGETLVQLDSAAADSNFFNRTIAALVSDSQPQRAAEYAARGAQKFPNTPTFYVAQGQLLRQLGQIPQSVEVLRKAYAIDPKAPNLVPLIIVGLSEMGQPDSAFAFGNQAIAAGADKAEVGKVLVAAVGPLVQKAQQSKLRADWQAAMVAAAQVDSLSQTPESAYFLAVSAFQVGLDALQKLNETRSCAEVQLAESTWNTAQLAMPRGARVDTNTAGQIMQAIQQYSANIQAAKKQLCK